jgi:catechol 2,3-dioxygenase-like lactoylglutathione lyase family enzyme
MTCGIEHVGLSVSNLDRSISFYCGILDFKLDRIIESGPEMGLGRIVGMDDAEARIAHLSSKKAMLELFEYRKPRGRPIRKDTRQADLGFIHIGIETEDLKEDYLCLKEKGVRFLGNPVEFRPGVWVVYFYGPDGEVCELRQT